MDTTTLYAEPAELKATDLASSGWFTGYAAVFDGDNTNGVAFAPGAFLHSLSQVKAASTPGQVLMPLLWHLNPHEPIGGITKAVEDGTGLRIEGYFDLDIEPGRRAYSAVKKGYAQGLSVAAQARKSTSKSGGYYVTEADLMAVSLVGSAVPGARITEVKSYDRFDTAGEAEMYDDEDTLAEIGHTISRIRSEQNLRRLEAIADRTLKELGEEEVKRRGAEIVARMQAHINTMAEYHREVKAARLAHQTPPPHPIHNEAAWREWKYTIAWKRLH